MDNNQQPKNYTVTVSEPPAPEPRSYLIIKEPGVARPYRVLDGVTREQLFANFLTEEQARQRIAEHVKDHSPKRQEHQLGTIDDVSEAALLAQESPWMRDFWSQKSAQVDRLEKHESKPKSEPEPEQPSGNPVTPVSVQEVADLEAKLKELQAAQAAREPVKPSGDEIVDIIEDSVQAKREVGVLQERIARVEQLTENISRLAEMYS